MQHGADEADLRVRFERVLAEVVGVPAYQRPFYWKWLSDFFGFCRIRHLVDRDRKGLDLFMEMMRKRGLQGFQIEQARVSVEVYWLHFPAESQAGQSTDLTGTAAVSRGPVIPKGVDVPKGTVADVSRGPLIPIGADDPKDRAGVGYPARVSVPAFMQEKSKAAVVTRDAAGHSIVGKVPDRKVENGLPGDWRMALAAVAREVGLRRYSAKTLKAYLHWVRDFSRFAGDVPVGALNEARAKEFLTHLAVERKVAASTQNQAFSALLFLYTNVLRIGMQGMADTPRAARRQEIPTVLTRGEVQAVLSALEYPYRLFCQMLYGCGLRLNEGLTLRVQDLDLGGGTVRVHYGKGDKSRSVPLPRTLVPALAKHLDSVRGVFESDVKVGYAGVFLPGLLDRKLPGAACSWPWQWVFPGGRLTVTQDDGKLRRFHLHESGVQKEIKSAAGVAKLTKRVTPHTFRHSYATHLLQMGYDIRTVQELMGHNDVETTMIYTHVLQAMSGKVVSPLDV